MLYLSQFVKQLYQYILKYYVRGYTDMSSEPSRIIFINLGESVCEGLKGIFPSLRNDALPI